MIASRCRYLFVIMPLIIASLSLKGQGVCSSSALAPVFSQTFGQGVSNSSKTTVPSGFTTNYDFQGSGDLNDGNYIVTPRVQNSGRDDWATGGDHTGNSNGNMFLVNAGTGAALFFTQQVDNLCPGSTYNFSAWLANVNTTSHTAPICGGGLVYPKVTFNIKNTSNVVLATYTTGDLPLTANLVVPPNWQQYGFSFTLPSGTTSLILEMVDFYGGQPQCGNDLAIDDIVFTACTPTATVAFTTASTVCTGTNSNIQVSLTNSPFTTPAYQWQKSTNNGSTWTNIGTASTSATSYPLSNIVLADAAQYRVLVGPDLASLSSNSCITASNVITLTVNPSPSVLLSSNSPVCSGNSINLTATASGGTAPFSYTWSGPNSFSSTAANPTIPNSAVVNGGTYSVVVTDNKSCTATNTVSVTVNATPTVAATTGSTTGCAGSTISLGNATAGGTWSSSNTAVATVNPSTGLVSVVSAGTATITYTVSSSGCSASSTTNITTHSVSLPPSIIECNSSTVNTQSNADYMPTYSNNDPSSTYLWTITPAPNFQGGSTNTDRYPKIQYANPVAYSVLLQFTSAGTTCAATQTVYRDGAEASSTIDGAATENVCNTTNTINLSASVAGYTNQFAWSSNGTGTFSNPNSLNTTYTFSAADKTSGQVVISFTGTTSLNINGNCLDNTDTDSKTINIEPPNTGTNTSSTICSNQLFTHTAASSVSGSSYTWVSTVLSGSGSGNATSGSGNISNTLTNLSATTDFVVRYTITPSSNGCPGTAYTVTVTVKPLPSLTITNNAPAICTGATTNVVLSDILSGTQYSWASSVISGTATGNSNSVSPTATNTISDILLNTTNIAAVVRYSITAHSSAGCTAVNTTDVTVYPQPTASNAGGDQSLCNVTAATLDGNIPTSGTGTWTFVSGPNTPAFTNASSPSTTVTGVTTGSYVFRWTIGNGVCTSSQDDVTVLVSPVTVVGSLSADATVCATANSGTLTVTGYTGNIINWQTSTDNGNTWNTSAVTTPTFPFNNLTTTTLFKASVQSGSCSVLFTNTVTISVLQPPTVANAGPDESRNGINSTTLAGNDPANGTGTWTQVSGPVAAPAAVIDDPNSYNTSITGLQLGNYVFRWTITNGACGSSFDEVEITVGLPTDPGTISSDATVCATINSGTLTLTGYIGDILRWQYSTDGGSNWVDITNITANNSYSNLTTTTMFRAEVKNGTDAAKFSAHVTITVLQPVTTANAGSNQILCDLTAANLLANDPTSGIGTWSFLSGPSAVSFNNANAYNSTVNGLTTGTYQFRWTISNGVCASSMSDVTIEVVAPTNPGTVAADATVCATSNGGTLSITGHVGTIVQGEVLSVATGGVWVPFTNVGVNSIVYPTLPVTTQFRALVKNSVCPAVHSNIVTITVLQTVTPADAGSDQDLCAATTATMAANNPSSGTGTWSNVSGPNAGTFTNAGAYNTTVTGLIPGTYVFRWTISNGACAPSQDDVTIVIHPSTVPGSIAGVATVCSGVNSGTITLTGNTGLIVRWEYSEDGGANWANIANNTSSYNYSNLTTTTLFKASVQSGVCLEQFTNNVLITVNTITVPGTLTGGTAVCAGVNNGNLSIAGNNGAVVRWEYSTDGGGNWSNIVHTSTTYSFSNLTTTTAFRALVQNGVCSNAYTNAVTVTVDAATVAGSLSSPAVLCYNNNNGTLNLSGNNGNVVRWEFSTDGGNNWGLISNTSNTQGYTNLTTATDYRAVIKNGTCASGYSNIVNLSINAATVAGSVSSDASVCITTNAGTLTLNGYTGSITGWELSINSGSSWSAISNTGATQSYTNLSATTFYRAIVKSGVCAQDYSTPAVITVNAATVAGTLSGAAIVCSGTNSGTLTLGGITGSVQRWEYSQDGGSNWNIIAHTSASYSYNNINTTTLYKALVQSGVCASIYSNQVTVTTDAAVITGSMMGSTTVCSGINSGTLTLTGNNGNILQWEYSTDGTNWLSIAHTNNSYGFNNLTQQTQYRAVVKNGVCAPVPSNTITVAVSDVTVPGAVTSNATVCFGSNNGSLSLTGHTGMPVRWESSVDGGGNWVQVINATDQHSYTNLTTSTVYRALVQSGVCPSQYATGSTITVDALTVPGTISADATVCISSNSGTLSLTGNTGNVVQWESSTNNGNSWAAISNTTTVQAYNNLAAVTLYRAQIKNGVCASQYANPVTITIDAATVSGTASSNDIVCSTSNNGTLNLTGNTGNIVQWESSTDNGSSWNTINNTTATHSYNNLTATSLFRTMVKNGVCAPQYSNNVIITVTSPTIPGSVSADATVCAAGNNGTLNLAGNTGDILYWERSSNNGSSWNILGNNTAAQSYNNLSATTQFRALVKNAVCASQYTNAVIITVTPVTVPGTVSSDATVCVSSNNGILNLSQHTGDIIQWESSTNNGTSWSTITNTTTTHNYNNILSNTLFRALVQNGICPSQYSHSSTITVVQPVTPADAGPAQILCSTSSTALMSGNTPSSGTGTWSFVNGNAGTGISDPLLNNTVITGLQTGAYTFRWTIANGVCPSSSSDVSIQVLPNIDNTVGITGTTICAGQQVNIAGTAATGGNGTYQYQWETGTDGTSWTNITGATAVGYSFTPTGSVWLRRTVLSNNCPSMSDPVSVFVQQALANNSINGDQAICDSTFIVPIKGNIATGGDGNFRYQWEQNSSSSSSGLNTNWTRVENATSVDLPEMRLRTTTYFRRIVTTALCNGPQALTSNTVKVDVKPLPRISIQYKGGAYCSKDSSVEFITNTQNVDSIRWNFGDGITQTKSAQNLTYRYNRPGVFVPQLLAISPGNCAVPLIAQDTIRIEEIKPGFRLTAVFECGKTFFRFVDTSQSYFTIAKRTWSINNAAVNNNANYQHLFTNMGDYNARLKLESVYGCTDTLNAAFKVSIFQFPKVNINAVTEACRNTLLELKSDINSVDSVIMRTWDLGNGVKASDSIVNVTYTSAGEYSVKLTAATINQCYDSAVKMLTIYPTPVLQLPAQQVMCKGDSLRLNVSGGVSYIWKDQNDNIICSNCATPTVRPANNTQYKVIGYSSFGCSEIGTTNVRVIPQLQLSAKLLDTLCAGESRRLTVTGGDNYQWLPAAGIATLNTANPVVTPPVTTTYTVIGKDAFNCFADTAEIRLVVGNPTSVSIGKDTVILAGNPIQLRAVSPLPDIRKWRWEGADFSCLNCPAPVAKIVNDACISCTVTNQYGCKATDTLCIKTFCPTTEVFIPNAFTPDGDGINDKLFVQGKGLKLIKSFRIFSRWGEMVFEKTNFSPGDPSMGWDGRIRGKLASPDVFVYVCEAVCEKGTPATFKGNVAIIK